MTPQDLRGSIIYLAMQGKLTKQCDDDESSKEFLRRYLNGKYDEPIDALFEIPQDWSWVSFSSIVNFRMGKTPPRAEAKFWGIDKPWVSIADMSPYGHISKTKEGVSSLATKDIFKETISPAGTLLMSFKLTVGRVSILDVDAYHNEAIISIYPKLGTDNVLRDYLYYLLPTISTFGQTKSAIKGLTLNKESISKLPIPLPPHEEQKRIVEKIERLMPLVDEYERVYSELETLNEGFPKSLEKSLSKLALRGKLVPQIEEEGSSQVIVNELQNIKRHLQITKEIRTEKPLPPIDLSKIPFDVPSSWRWVRFGDLGVYKKGPFGSALVKGIFVKKGPQTIKVYEQKNAIQKDATLGEYYITAQYFEEHMKSFEVFPGDIIVSCAGTIGEIYVMPPNIERGIINQALMRMRIFKPIYLPYFLFVFDSLLKANAKASSSGTAIKNIPPFDVLKNYLVPIPPFSEQKRIVSKIEELTSLIMKLRAIQKEK